VLSNRPFHLQLDQPVQLHRVLERQLFDDRALTGPGSRNDKGDLVPIDVVVGDEIIFSKYGGAEVKVGADEILILRETDVLAKVVATTAKKSRKKELAGATA
jgi:hypothetical protein